MINPYGLAALPNVIKLVSDVAQARAANGAAIAGSVFDYVNAMYSQQQQFASQAQQFSPQPFAQQPFAQQPFAPPRQPAAQQFAAPRFGLAASAPQPIRTSTVEVHRQAPATWTPARVSFVESDDAYTAFVEIPYAQTDDISVKIDNNQVYVQNLASSDAVSAVLAIPDGADLDAISADYADGVLQLRIQKDSKRFRRDIRVRGTAKPTAASQKT